MMDLIDQVNTNTAMEAFKAEAHRLFKESIRRAPEENPHMHFWMGWLCTEMLFRPPNEIYRWSQEYMEDLMAWLQLNYLDTSKYFSTGIYPREDHILSIH